VVEAFIVFAAVALLAGAGLVAPSVQPELVTGSGMAVAGLGLVLGLPTGLLYHVKLRQSLLARRALPARWWLRPVSLHERIPPEDRRGVLVWFYLGGAGFAATVAGCLIASLGVALLLFGSHAP